MKRPKFGKLDISDTIKTTYDNARELDMKMIMQWIPSHAGIKPNEAVDKLVKTVNNETPDATQQNVPLEPATIRRYLIQHETMRFHQQVLTDTQHHTGSR